MAANMRERWESMSTNDKMLQMIFDSSPDGISIASLDGRVLDANPAFLNMLGYTPDELRNMYYTSFTPEKWHVPELDSRASMVFDGSRHVYESECIRKDGTVFPVQITGWLLRDPDESESRICVFIRDISLQKRLEKEREELYSRIKQYNQELEERVAERTVRLTETNSKLICEIAERVAAEDKIRAAEEMLRALFNATTETIMMVDPEGIIHAINDIGARRFNREAEDLIGTCVYDYIPGDVAQSRREKVEEVVRTGKPVRFEDERRGHIYDLSMHPIFSRDLKVVNVTFFARDISPLLKLQKEIISISDNERRMLGQDLHDDLGQYLTGISYMITVLEQEMEEKSSDEISQVQEISIHIKNAIERLRRLARGLSPVSIADNDFLMAVSEMCLEVERIFRISCRLETRGSVEIENNYTATHLFYIAQESINNALKHGKAQQIVVFIEGGALPLHMRIENDINMRDRVPGKGSRGIGIDIMKYRANIIGAEIEIISTDDKFMVDLHMKTNK